MYILIRPSDSLKQTNSAFQQFFGLLKLAFYDHRHQKGQLSDPEKALDDALLWESLGVNDEVRFNFDKTLAVVEFEKQFAENLHVGVQVLRNSKGVWLQTGATDEWSLAEQQAKAEEMNHGLNEKVEPTDYQEQE